MKRSVIDELDTLASEQTIIASNSSSFVISEIIEGLSLKQPFRVLSAHCCESHDRTHAISAFETNLLLCTLRRLAARDTR